MSHPETEQSHDSHTILAARLHAAGTPLVIEPVARRTPGPDEVRVTVKAAGVCATELHFTDGFYEPASFPAILGHEAAGVVDEVGSAVSGWSAGDRVVANYYLFCGACRWCLRGQHNLCRRPRGWMAFQSDGAFAQEVIVPAACLVEIPDHISYTDAAPLGCSASTAVHAVTRAGVMPADVVVVIGGGGVGQSILQVARNVFGAAVVVVDRDSNAREACLRMGAVAAVSAEEAHSAVQEVSGGEGASAVFELVARSETLNLAMQVLEPRGRLVLIGYSEDTLTVAPFDLVASELAILACAGNTQDELRRAVALAAQGQISSVTKTVLPFSEVNAALDMLRDGGVGGRIVLRMP